ncbi:hypothetical protein BC941DRAFT_448383 [Chlamydoabsidia padenii]|nr:hypothetical protein BC941DRAFT_448383 [Chlamydoabsidia padenii]
MALNNAVSSCLDPAYEQQQQQQGVRCSLPFIPHDLIQPLRDALPKIDEALLSSVPVEAVPLCQQLFDAWLSTNAPGSDITRPPRAKTTMNIASLCQQPSPPLLPQKEHQQEERQQSKQQHPPPPPDRQPKLAQAPGSLIKSNMPNQCRKSQSTSRLSSWFSWTFPKRRNPVVVPIDQEKKKSAHQNISDFVSVNATKPRYLTPAAHTTSLSPADGLQHQQKQSQPPALPQRPQVQQIHQPRVPPSVHHHSTHQHTQSHPDHEPQKQQGSHHPPELSPSLSSSSSTTTSTSTSATYLSRTSQRVNDNNSTGYRRSFSFMLSRLGTKVRRVIQSSSQGIHPQLRSANITGTTQPLSDLTRANSNANHISASTNDLNIRKLKGSVSLGTDVFNNVGSMKKHLDNTPLQTSSNIVESIRPTVNSDDNNNDDTQSDISRTNWKELSFDIPQSSTLATLQKDLSANHNDTEMTTITVKQSTAPLLSASQDGRSFYSTMFQEIDDDDYSEYSEDDDDDDHTSKDKDKVDDTGSLLHQHSYGEYDINLKTPWSPPSSSAKRIIKSSKTDVNMKNELSVPFIKMGLGKRNGLDVEDQVQYTTRSMSSTSFALQWQEKFHDQQQPRERIVGTLKSVSMTLYNIICHNHAYQQFNSDNAYVAHPNFDPGRNTKELFAPVPLTHWRDIFDQIAYIYDNGVLTAEHAIITMIYIERMLENSKQHLCEVNWRLIVLAGLIASIKVWDDCAVYNMDFVHIFPELNIKHMYFVTTFLH